MPSGTLNDRPRPRLRAAVVLAVLAVPFLMGAAAPAAFRAWMPVETAPLTIEGLPGPPVGAAPEPVTAGRFAPALVSVESIVGLPAARARSMTQTARLTDLPPGRDERRLPPPNLRPSDPGWVARRVEIPALGVDVVVAVAANAAHEDFPPHGGAYILRSSAQPGRGTNSYPFAHAMPNLFKPLWWAQVGQQVIVTLSDGQQLSYRISAVVRDVPCPDPNAPKPAGLPPALANATECDTSWTLPTAAERLTMQTSQGFNRNYGELIVLAVPDW